MMSDNLESVCPICNKQFESDKSNEFTIHVNACLDEQEHEKIIPKNFHIEDEAKLHPLIRKQREKRQATDCVVCGKVKATAAHIKKCGKQYNVDTNQLIKLVKESEEQNVNPNLQNIKLKNTTLNQNEIVNNLFTDNNLTSQLIKPDVSIVLDNQNLGGDYTQTKLKVVRKSTSNKLPNGFTDDKPLHAIKKRKTVKIKRNPLVKANLDNVIIQNFKDEFICEKELPISWKMANLSYDSSSYIVDGFQEFCKCYDFKEKMNGFEI